MSVFMVSMPVAVLSDSPPESKVIPLPTRSEVRDPSVDLEGIGRSVVDPDQPGRLGRATGHPEQPAEPLRDDAVLVPHLDGEFGHVGEPPDEDVGEGSSG